MIDDLATYSWEFVAFTNSMHAFVTSSFSAAVSLSHLRDSSIELPLLTSAAALPTAASDRSEEEEEEEDEEDEEEEDDELVSLEEPESELEPFLAVRA